MKRSKEYVEFDHFFAYHFNLIIVKFLVPFNMYLLFSLLVAVSSFLAFIGKYYRGRGESISSLVSFLLPKISYFVPIVFLMSYPVTFGKIDS